jgi:MFS family permease
MDSMETEMTSAAPSGDASSWRDLLSDGRAPLLALILLGDWLVAADALVTTTIMPSVGRALAGYAWFGWAASAFLTGTVVAGASAGWLSERVGLRKAMVLTGLVLALGCTMSALAPDMAWFMAGRVLQGVAGGWVLGLIYIAMATSFPSRHLPRLFALVTSVWGVATFVGPLLGGLFADSGLWRGVFWLFAGQALLFAVATLWLVPAKANEAHDQRVPVGPLTVLTIAIALISAAGVVSSAALAVALLGVGVVTLLAAVRGDLRSVAGLLPAQLRNAKSALGAAYIVYFMTNAAGIAYSLYGPALLRATMGMSGLAAGYVIATEAVTWTAVALAVSGFGERWRNRCLVIGPVLILSGLSLQSVALGGTSLPSVFLSGALLGCGFGSCYAFLGQRVMALLDEAETARGSGAIAAVRGAGNAVGAAVASIGANAAGFAVTPDAAHAPAIALAAFGVSVPFAVWAVVAAVRVVRASPRQAAEAIAAAA